MLDDDLRGADLRDAVLRDTDLRGADLRDTHMNSVDLSGAQLQGANLGFLTDVDLSGANLLFVIGLTQEKLDQACGTGARVDTSRLTFHDRPCPPKQR